MTDPMPKLKVAPAPKRVLFCGPSGSGKDVACRTYATATGLTNAGTASKYLAPYVAALGITPEEAYRLRHVNTADQIRIGHEVRKDDPAILVRQMLAVGPVGGGLRAKDEIRAARAEGLFDLAVWIERIGGMPVVDTTLEFGPEECDLVLHNDGTEEEFVYKVCRLAAAVAGVLPMFVFDHTNRRVTPILGG